MKKYVLTTRDGDVWTYDDYDQAARAKYIFGGKIQEKLMEDSTRTVNGKKCVIDKSNKED